jgi:hypothetical protein
MSVVITPNGANMNINLSNGSYYRVGCGTTIDQPNTKTVTGVTATPFKLLTQTGFVSDTTTTTFPNAANYDLSGVVIPNPGANGSACNHRIYLLEDNTVCVMYGQLVYSNLNNALAAISTEAFVIPSSIAGAILLCIVSVVKNATALNNTGQCIISNSSSIGATNLNGVSSSSAIGGLATGYNGQFSSTTLGAGNFTVPVGITSIRVTLCGGGGSGGTSTINNPSNGGGPGGCATKTIRNLTPGQVIPYSIASSVGGNQAIGNTTVFGATTQTTSSYFYCTGGNIGGGQTSGGVQDGTFQAGNIVIHPGTQGDIGFYASGSAGFGGKGGGNMLSGQTKNSLYGSTGLNGNVFGGGGSGAVGSLIFSGGNGGAGVILIYY